MRQMEQRSIVVCVQNPGNCSRLIQAGKKVAEITGSQLQILHVEPQTEEKDPMTLEALYQVAKDADAELTVFFSDNPVVTAALYIENSGADQVITGMPDMEHTSFVDLLRQFVPQVTISMVSDQGIAYHIYPQYSGISAR